MRVLEEVDPCRKEFGGSGPMEKARGDNTSDFAVWIIVPEQPSYNPRADAESKRRRLLAGTLSMRHLLAESPVDLAQLVLTSRWITPIGISKRFDTYFFLASVGRDVVATPEQSEAVEAIWIAPADALARDDLQLVFPTIRNLEALAGFATSGELMASRRGADVPATRPILVMRDGQKKIVLP